MPPAAIAEAARQPRLRRSSAISRFAVVAGLSALRDAGVALDEASAARTALIFAISNGGVIYTKRFYHEIVQSGASAASPLLFPETVFNAPASHLAAILGITGASYTLVGDGAVGILALQMAEDLMANPELDRCLVVGAEEADWLLCDAYRKWRLMRAAPPVEPFAQPPRGMVLSEGAGAVLLAREGDLVLERVHPGGNFARQSELVRELEQIATELPNETRDRCLDRERERDLHRRGGARDGGETFPGRGGLQRQAGARGKRGRGGDLAGDLRRRGLCAGRNCRRSSMPRPISA